MALAHKKREMNMTKHAIDVVKVIQQISKQLQSAYKDSILCQQYAWWILEAITKKTKTTLISQETIIIAPTQQKTIEEWLAKLINEKMPIQYLIGFVPFNSVKILVKPPILIPRPETEEWCLKLIKQLHTLENKKLTILDLCAGSGCIALALAKNFPQAIIYASDLSQEAITLIKQNIAHNKISNIIPLHSDLFTAIPLKMQFDLIVANPPYVSLSAWKQLDDSVASWEDPNALIAGDDGLTILRKIIKQAPIFIKPNNEMKEKSIPQLIMEIGDQQREDAITLLKNADYNNILVQKDLEQKDRTVSGRIDNVATSFTQ
jgi:release factor glutamine methyltransferase